MIYHLENDTLILSVSSKGGEMVSLMQADTKRQLLWQADPAVWNRHAPLLFPYAGNLRDKKFTWEGKEYAAKQHGFARDMEFSLAQQTADRLDLVLHSSAETLEKFPFDFELHSIYTLKGNTVVHTVQVKNPGQSELRFGFGFHPAFACPFDGQHSIEDYELRFDTPQDPIVVETSETTGLVTGKRWSMLEQPGSVIALQPNMFDHDSICMSQLSAKSITIAEKNSSRSVTVGVQGFPYVLLWSVPHKPIHFVCIEPWHTLPDTADTGISWADKNCAAILQPGQSWQTTLPMMFQW